MSEKTLETRSYSLELRSKGDDTATLTGYAVKWNERSQPLPFVERFLPGAFTKSLEGGRDVLALVGHDLSKVIGRRSNDTLRLTEDDTGLRVEIDIDDATSYGRDILAQVKRRDVTQMSVGFRTVTDNWSIEDGDELREIIEAELVEVSTASLPAYTGTTVNQRSESHMEVRTEETAVEETAAATETVATEERNEQAEPTTEERTERRTVPTVLSTPAHDTEQRSAFASYLRGQAFDTRALTNSPATAGGYVAPDGFIAELIKALTEASVMRQIADIKGPIANRSVTFPVLTEGVAAGWTPEAQAITPSDAKFGHIEFTPHKLAALTMASNELLADSAINVEQLLAELFGEEFADVEDAAFFGGNGDGKPGGILEDDDIGTVNAGADITADDVINLYTALPPRYRAGSVFVMHPGTEAALRTLKDDNGQYLLVAGLADATPTTLFGRPVYLSENMPEVDEGEKAILYGDIKRAYRIVDRVGVDVQRSSDRYFEQDMTAFRAIKRTDGKVILPEAARFLVTG